METGAGGGGVAPQRACLRCGPGAARALGMWPDHHLGSWGAGGSAPVTFNNLPVCHLGSGSNKNEISLGVVCSDVVYGVAVAAEEALCSGGTHFYRRYRFYVLNFNP